MIEAVARDLTEIKSKAIALHLNIVAVVRGQLMSSSIAVVTILTVTIGH